MSQTYRFAIVSPHAVEHTEQDLNSVGIRVLPRLQSAIVDAYGTEDQLRRLKCLGYDVDCWELNDRL